jgi:phosphoglycerate kinase
VKDSAQAAIAAAAPGSVLMLQNTRAYAIETLLWKAKEANIPELAPRLTNLANSVAEKIANVYINEALSAGSLDASSTVIPAAMQRVALGKYIAGEFDGPMLRCIESQLVVFSGCHDRPGQNYARF